MSGRSDTFLGRLPPDLLVAGFGGVLQRSVGFLEVPLEQRFTARSPNILLKPLLLLPLHLLEHGQLVMVVLSITLGHHLRACRYNLRWQRHLFRRYSPLLALAQLLSKSSIRLLV